VTDPERHADPPLPGTFRWQSDGGLEHAVLTDATDGFRVESVVVGPRDAAPPFALSYHVACDAHWRTREFGASVPGAGRQLLLRSDGMGAWHDATGRGLPQLGGCLDVDFTATPFTNTLPIRRLGLREGGEAVVRVAFVDAPALIVSVSEQRYTRLGRRAYRFELTDGSFARDIRVDDAGFVVDYPGLFRRQDG
jgi:hypothetical protein